MDALGRRGIPARLTVVGAGAEETQLREASRHHMEAGRMRLLGVLPNEKILGLLEHEDAFIMTSEFEGMPNALLEAMGRGCVPVVTDIRSGIPEVVRDGDSGYLVPVGDVDGFAERFARLQRDPEHRRAMSSRAYRTVDEGTYRTRDMARDYQALFERVLSEAGGYDRPRGPLSLPPREVAGMSILPMPFPYAVEGVGAFPSRGEAEAFLAALPAGKARELLGRRRISRGGWILADGQGPAVCVATSTPNALSESTFIRAHMQRLPARVTVLAGLEPPPLSEDDLPVAASKRDRILRAAGRRLLRRDFAKATDAAIARHLLRERVTAVLAEYGPTGARLLSACRLARIPLIVHFHGYDASVRKVVEGHGRYAKLFAGAAAVIAVSRDMEARLLALGAPPERLHYIPYGVDTALFAAGDPAHAPPVFVSVGRFVEKKSPELTLVAFRKVRDEVPEARLVMIGDGPLLGPAQRLARALALDEAVTFRGAEPPSVVAAALAGSRAFVQHSVTALDGDEEGTPLSVIEASAAGLPVVATRHAGIKDVVVEGVTGYLVAEGDVDAMAGHMIRLAREPELAAGLGRAGRARAGEHFSIERRIGELWEVIRGARPPV
jgi:glycosyltransferase involved in cell wall biosynthesis